MARLRTSGTVNTAPVYISTSPLCGIGWPRELKKVIYPIYSSTPSFNTLQLDAEVHANCPRCALSFPSNAALVRITIDLALRPVHETPKQQQGGGGGGGGGRGLRRESRPLKKQPIHASYISRWFHGCTIFFFAHSYPFSCFWTSQGGRALDHHSHPSPEIRHTKSYIDRCCIEPHTK